MKELELEKVQEDEENKWCVYCHTNKINGKKYFGITGQRPETRWKAGSPYKRNTHFWRAIQKYGWYDGFLHEVISSNLTKDEACNLEVELIAKYNTTDQRYGYNQTSGGEASFVMTDEVKQKMKDNHYDCSGENGSFYGKHHTEETKEKIRQARIGKYSGKNSPKYGKHPSEETRKKMSESKKGKCLTKDTKKKMSEQRIGFKNGSAKRPVYCVELNEIFWGAMEVKNKYGINDNVVRFAIKGVREYGGKHPETGERLHWLYTEDAIRQGYITQQQCDDYFNNLKMEGNDIYGETIQNK